jgi:hypothetical protein
VAVKLAVVIVDGLPCELLYLVRERSARWID